MESGGLKIVKSLVAIFLIINIIVWFILLSKDNRDTLKVVFLDVGQGDSVYIEAPNGNSVLIDGGPNASVLRGLGSVISFYDRDIDLVVATHPDSDHIGGLPFVFDRYEISNYLESGASSDSLVFNRLKESIQEENSVNYLSEKGLKIILDSENSVFIEILNSTKTNVKDANESSIVTRLTYGDSSFLFTGDAPQSIERSIVLDYGTPVDSDVLKIGHHGSKTGTAKEFLDIVSPDYSIISAGKDNRYGHPHREVISLLESVQTKILKTFEDGRIEFESNGGEPVLIK